jgi:hypothetical protein
MSAENVMTTEQIPEIENTNEEEGEQQKIQYDRIELEAQGQLKLPFLD